MIKSHRVNTKVLPQIAKDCINLVAMVAEKQRKKSIKKNKKVFPVKKGSTTTGFKII